MRDRVFQRAPGGPWYTRLYIGGRQRTIRLGRMDKKQAEIQRAKLVVENDRSPYRPRKEISFRELAELWISSYAEGRIRESTLIRYKQLINLHLLPYFGDKQIRTISKENIEHYIATKNKEGTLKPATINRTRSVLHEMLGHAIGWDYLEKNPVSGVKPLRVPRKEPDILSIKEIEIFFQTAADDVRTLFYFAIYSGARRGEILAAKWANMDWNKEQYCVRESVFRGKFVEPKSTAARRAVDLPPILISELKALRARQNEHRLLNGPDWQSNDLIFPSSKGKPIDPGHLETRIFKPTVKRAGIRQIRFHDLRHTNAALRILAGEHPKRMQNQMGHSSIKVTLDIYGHLMEEVRPGAAERLQNLLFKGEKPPLQGVQETRQLQDEIQIEEREEAMLTKLA